METKYNLNITTSGENGDNATTTITTSDATKLADLLKLAGMSQAHPVALNVSPEEHDYSNDKRDIYDVPCSGCGESPCGCEGMTEGESWDNEPDEFVHSPEEVLKTGDDLHKVKKSYPPVAGGDNPMALESAENKLRGMYAEFIAESEEEVVKESNELVSPWAKTETVNEGHGWMKGYSKYHCEDCGCQMHHAKSDCGCEHDPHDESGSWWKDENGNGVPDVMESAEQQTMETNTMNLNDIRRLAGLKEEPVEEAVKKNPFKVDWEGDEATAMPVALDALIWDLENKRGSVENLESYSYWFGGEWRSGGNVNEIINRLIDSADEYGGVDDNAQRQAAQMLKGIKSKMGVGESADLAEEDYTAPDVGDIIDHKELGRVKVIEVTDSDTYGGPAEYRVEVVLSHDQLVGAVELGK